MIKASKDDQIAPAFENQKALLKSSTAFQNFMQEECTRQNSLTMTGNLTGGLAEISCKIEMTKSRITALKIADE